MRTQCFLSLTCLVIMLGGGGCHWQRDKVSFPSPRPLGKTLAAYVPPTEPSETPVTEMKIEEPKGAITLQQVLALALMKNPSLASYGWEVRAKEARTLQASLPPNPELSIEIEDILLKTKKTKTTKRTATFTGGAVEIERETETEEGPPSGLRGGEYTVALSQVIEMGGKRIKRTNLAAMEQKLAGWDYETARLDILTEATKGFIDVIAAQERVALSQELVRLAEHSLGIVSERVKAGKVSPLEESKGRVALANSLIGLQQARQRLKANQKRLAYAWGTWCPSFTKAMGDLYKISPVPAEEKMISVISENPDLARWADEMDQRLAAVELERARGVPDLTVSGGYRWIGAENNSALVVGVSSPLPVYDRNQGGTQEARYRVAKALEDRESAKIRVRTSLAEAYQELSSAYFEATTLQREVIPEAQSAFRAAEEGFERGKFGYLEVLDAQRIFFEVRERYISALVTYHKARADVERLMGAPIISIHYDYAKERK